MYSTGERVCTVLLSPGWNFFARQSRMRDLLASDDVEKSLERGLRLTLRLNLRIPYAVVICVISLLLNSSATVATSQTKSNKSGKHHSGKSTKKSTKATSHGQRGIDQKRTRAIQQALIHEHYLSGEPTGKWDQDTKDALVRYQAENGWQTKVTPDSRALIKLGLGPDKTGLLNPDTALMSSPHD